MLRFLSCSNSKTIEILGCCLILSSLRDLPVRPYMAIYVISRSEKEDCDDDVFVFLYVLVIARVFGCSSFDFESLSI